jgi:hypothetical protein
MRPLGKRVDAPSVVRRILEVLDGAAADSPGPELESTVRAYVEAQAVHVCRQHHETTSPRRSWTAGCARAWMPEQRRARCDSTLAP